MRKIIQQAALHSNRLAPTVYPLQLQQFTVSAAKTVNRTSTIVTLQGKNDGKIQS
jgi:hypothetical protein